LHCQGLADHSSCSSREFRPIRTELEFQWNACDHANRKVDGEYLGPEAGTAVVVLVPCAERHGLENYQEQRQPHSQLRKNVMEGDREGELETVNCKRRV